MSVIDGNPPAGANAQWSFPPQPDTPGRARHELDLTLDAWGVPPDGRWPAVLVMSELVTNAVEHAGTALHLGVTVTGDGLLIEVRDESAEEPQLRPSGAATWRGHGLRVVQGLAGRWSWISSNGGKTVWATVPLSDDGYGDG